MNTKVELPSTLPSAPYFSGRRIERRQLARPIAGTLGVPRPGAKESSASCVERYQERGLAGVVLDLFVHTGTVVLAVLASVAGRTPHG